MEDANLSLPIFYRERRPFHAGFPDYRPVHVFGGSHAPDRMAGKQYALVPGVSAGGGTAVRRLVFGWTRLTAAFPVSPLFFAAVAVLLPILLAGGLHMDGFLDATDALFSRRDREKKLAIMKDPNCGPFAVLCCAGLLLLEAGAWCQLMTAPGLLPAACSVYLLSRSLTVVAGSRFPYTPSSTLGVLFASRAAKGVAALGTVETALSLLLLLGLGGTLRRMAGAAGRRCSGDRRRPALLVVPLMTRRQSAASPATC